MEEALLCLRVYDAQICCEAKIHCVLLEACSGGGYDNNHGNSDVFCNVFCDACDVCKVCNSEIYKN